MAPSDLAEFWSETVKELARTPMDSSLEPITSILIVSKIFAKVSAGPNSPSEKTSSPSNNSVLCMYALVDETSAMAKNGKTALRANLETCGRE